MMELRPYQTASIDQLRFGMRNENARQILCASTGAGKSIVMMEMIRKAQEKGSRLLFIVDRRVLVQQFSNHLDRAGIDHGVWMAGHWRHRPHEKVQVASIQTLEKLGAWPQFDVCFIDEVHACMRKSVLDMITSRPKAKIIGATATPFNPLLGKHFTNIVNVVTMQELVRDGFLVPFRVFIAHEVDTNGVKVTAGEWQKDELESRALQIVGDVVADYIKISHQVFGDYRKTICFSAGVAHGAELVQRFAEAGINAVQLSYRDDEEYKQEVLDDFAKPDTDIQVLISADLLTRGFDCTDLEHVILARPLRKSFSSHVQMLGRGARPHDGKGFCVIQDNSGNWLRFQDDWDSLYSDGVKHLRSDVDKKPPKEKSEFERERAKCPKCNALWPKASDTCAVCGHVRIRRNLVGSVAGEIHELGDVRKPEKHSLAYKTAFYAQLIGYVNGKGWKEGAAFHMYKEKFGVGPAMLKPEGVPPGVEVINWITHRNIKRAKARSA